MKTFSSASKKGFTLLELLIVIAILAILMSIIVVTLNPAELLKKSRDTKRISDLSSLRTALNLYIVDVANPDLDGSGACGTNRWYSVVGMGGLTSTASGGDGGNRTTVSVASENNRNVDGTGWLPVAFSGISSGSPLASLPIDPTNATSTTQTNNLYYTYDCDSTNSTFELNAQMESAYFSQSGSGDVESTDGGNAVMLYEVGSDPGLNLATSTYTDDFFSYSGT